MVSVEDILSCLYCVALPMSRARQVTTYVEGTTNLDPKFVDNQDSMVLDEPAFPTGDIFNHDNSSGSGSGSGDMVADGSEPRDSTTDLVAAAHEIKRFATPDHTMVSNQTGTPPATPRGCTAVMRSGWDIEGWWYRGRHDSCPVPSTHRHDCGGQVTFAGVTDVLELVMAIIDRIGAEDV
jgi:hypothetical protein